MRLCAGRKDGSPDALFRMLHGMKCVRYISQNISKIGSSYSVKVCGGEEEIPFKPGDTLVFTSDYLIKFPGENTGSGQLQIYILHRAERYLIRDV